MQAPGIQTSVPAMRLLCEAIMAYDRELPDERIEHKYAVRCVNTVAGEHRTRPRALHCSRAQRSCAVCIIRTRSGLAGGGGLMYATVTDQDCSP